MFYGGALKNILHLRDKPIANGYELDGPGIEFRWGARIYSPVQTDPGAHPVSCKTGTGNFPRLKGGRGVQLTTHRLLVPRSWKSRAILLLPYGPYSLYRASVPVQYSYTSTPLWTVQPVQSLSACTVQLYLYSPYGPYSLYRASVPAQYSYTSTPTMDRPACTDSQCLYKGALYLLFTTLFCDVLEAIFWHFVSVCWGGIH